LLLQLFNELSLSSSSSTTRPLKPYRQTLGPYTQSSLASSWAFLPPALSKQAIINMNILASLLGLGARDTFDTLDTALDAISAVSQHMANG
jgi:hypothetical protein